MLLKEVILQFLTMAPNESSDALSLSQCLLEADDKEQSLRSFLDNACNDEVEWTGQILFNARQSGKEFSNINILQFVGNSSYKSSFYNIYFCPETYQVDEELFSLASLPYDSDKRTISKHKFKSTPFQSLSAALIDAAQKSGFTISRNGTQHFSSKNGVTIRQRFTCQKYQKYKPTVSESCNVLERNDETFKDFRKITYHSNRVHQRIKGRTLCRRAYSSLAMNKCTRCKFYFYIDFDTTGFFIVPGIGNTKHINHPQIKNSINSVQKRSLGPDDKDFIDDMGSGKIPTKFIQHAVFQKTGKLIPRSTIKYLTNYNKRSIINDQDYTNLFSDQETSELSSTEYIMRHCRAKGYNFQLLLNDPTFSSDPVSETYTNDAEEPVKHTILDFSDKEIDSLKQHVNHGRVASSLTSEHKYMMGFAWVVPSEILLLEAFPHVVYIDTTEKTNNEKRPLLTVGAKDSNGKVFIFLRVFMPNQQAWMFRWILSVVFPRLIPKHIHSKIKIIISDGDPQEYLQIDNAIQVYFPSLTRVRCAWHIISKGLEDNVDMKFPDVPADVVRDQRAIILSWILSWTKDHCETYLEFRYSYYLFMKYIFSFVVTSRFGQAFPNNIAQFIRRHVLTWEKWILFCHRRTIRHYGEDTNCPLEGTNYGAKHSSVGTHPQLPLENTFDILSTQSQKKIVSLQDKVINQSKSTPTHCKLDAIHCKITIPASEELRNTEYSSKKYKSMKVSDVEWKVYREKSSFRHLNSTVLPIFDRVYSVTLNEKEQLNCSCSRGNVWGLPCAHTLCVANSFKPLWKGLCIHDISVIWWKSYYLYSLPSKIISDLEKQNEIKKAFHALRDNENIGIRIPKSITDTQSITLSEDIPHHIQDRNAHIVKCYNYPNSDEMSDFDPFMTHFDPTMSQVVETNNDLTQDENDDMFDFIEERMINHELTVQNKKKTFYTKMLPHFREAVNWITDDTDTTLLECMFSEFVGKMKEKNQVNLNVEPQHVYISSNIPCETAIRHHGCNGYQTKRRRR